MENQKSDAELIIEMLEPFEGTSFFYFRPDTSGRFIRLNLVEASGSMDQIHFDLRQPTYIGADSKEQASQDLRSTFTEPKIPLNRKYKFTKREEGSILITDVRNSQPIILISWAKQTYAELVYLIA